MPYFAYDSMIWVIKNISLHICAYYFTYFAYCKMQNMKSELLFFMFFLHIIANILVCNPICKICKIICKRHFRAGWQYAESSFIMIVYHPYSAYWYIWNPIRLVYGGTYRYVQVHIGTYKYIPICTLLQYIPVRTLGNLGHNGTYRYVLVRSVVPQITQSTYEHVLLLRSMVVHGGLWQYMQNSITV